MVNMDVEQEIERIDREMSRLRAIVDELSSNVKALERQIQRAERARAESG